MDRRFVIQYLNMTLGRPYFVFTQNDAKMMAMRIKQKLNVLVTIPTIIEAAKNSPVDMRSKYLEGMWNSLIGEYDVNLALAPNGLILKYR